MKKRYIYLLGIILLASCTSNYEKGEKELAKQHYENAWSLFQLVEKGNKDYSNAQLKISQIENVLNNEQSNHKIDSIFKSNPNLEEKTEEKSTQKSLNERIKTKSSLSLKETKRKIKQLYNSLLQFKNHKKFHDYGFAVCCEYNYWMVEVGYLKDSPYSDILYDQGYSVISLEQVGLAYLRSEGKETEFTKYAREKFLWALR